MAGVTSREALEQLLAEASDAAEARITLGGAIAALIKSIDALVADFRTHAVDEARSDGDLRTELRGFGVNLSKLNAHLHELIEADKRRISVDKLESEAVRGVVRDLRDKHSAIVARLDTLVGQGANVDEVAKQIGALYRRHEEEQAAAERVTAAEEAAALLQRTAAATAAALVVETTRRTGEHAAPEVPAAAPAAEVDGLTVSAKMRIERKWTLAQVAVVAALIGGWLWALLQAAGWATPPGRAPTHMQAPRDGGAP